MMSKEEFFIFLRVKGGLIYTHKKADGPIYDYCCECDDGWLELISELISELIAAGWTREIRQIKEKFGGLCFYIDGADKIMIEIIIKYQRLSYSVCEKCGSTNNVSLQGTSWVKTLCEQCAAPWLKKRKRNL